MVSSNAVLPNAVFFHERVFNRWLRIVVTFTQTGNLHKEKRTGMWGITCTVRIGLIWLRTGSCGEFS